MDDSNEVVEAEVLEGDTQASGNQSAVLLSLIELIKTNINSIDKLSLDLRKQREMFDDSFNNDPLYRDQTEKVKEANKVKSATKQQIMKQPSVMQLSNQVKSLRSEIKERQSSLSDYLQEYQRLTGASEIENDNGELLRIVNSSKLVKEGSK